MTARSSLSVSFQIFIDRHCLLPVWTREAEYCREPRSATITL